jgi:hypothetical protein
VRDNTDRNTLRAGAVVGALREWRPYVERFSFHDPEERLGHT